MKLSVSLEIDDPDLPLEVVQRLNEVLARVAEGLRLERRG